MLYRFSRAVFLAVLRMSFGFSVKGKEYLPETGGFILAGNHFSYLDPVAMGCASNRVLNYMARSDLFSVPILGLWMWSVGVIPVKRKAADLSAIKEAIRRVNRGEVLGLFPEGTRQLGTISEKAEPGVGFLAARLKVPVIPAFIKGTEIVLPKGAKTLKQGRISVTFGRPIKFEEGMSYDEIASVIMHSIRLLAAG